MENIEVHSKDFLVRWVHVAPGSKLTWKVTPTKRSINFGVYERGGPEEDSKKIVQTMSQTSGSVAHRLETAGCIPLAYSGFVRVEAKDALEGSASVDYGNMIAFVFDNTFSKNYSKHVELTFHVEVPAQRPTHHGLSNDATAAAAAAAALKGVQGTSSRPTTEEHHASTAQRTRESPVVGQQQFPQIDTNVGAVPVRRDTVDSAYSIESNELESPRVGGPHLRQRQSTLSSSGGNDQEPTHSVDGRYVTGFLAKKRRKQFQGFARRYFSLDKKMGLLNYYLNQRSRSLRGVMPMRIADVTTDAKNLTITLDSGMEKWTLKAGNLAAFEAWQRELEFIRSSGFQESESDSETSTVFQNVKGSFSQQDARPNAATGSTGVGSAFSSSGGAQDALNELKAYISGLPIASQHPLHSIYQRLSGNSSSGDGGPGDRTPRPAATTVPSSATIIQDKKSRKREPPNTGSRVKDLLIMSKPGLITGAIAGLAIGSVLGSFVVLMVIIVLCSLLGATAFLVLNPRLLQRAPVDAYPDKPSRRRRFSEAQGGSLSDDGYDMSGDSDVEDAEDDLPVSNKRVSYIPQKPKHTPESHLQSARLAEKDQLQEFATEDPEVVAVFRRIAEENKKRHNESKASNASIISEVPSAEPALDSTKEGSQALSTAQAPAIEESSAETSLYPLPHSEVHRRKNIKGPTQAPPSLISMLKKAQSGNMVAPITANEPLTGLEYTAEIFENSGMLDAASHASPKSHLRVMLVAVFAVARISGVRSKERALRKPFTPLLGETYEMVREDRGLRFVSEKVMHKPEVIATQTESTHWTAHFTSRPHTKMWAKTVQITDVGHFNVTFPDGESISYINPEMFIRNILAGERYVEPSGTFTVESSAGGHLTANVEFKSKGMFGGRSEDVKITCGNLVYEGKWSEAIYNNGKVVWTAKPMVEDPTHHWGWPLFVAQLNEKTPIEEGSLPPNDSRIRPDLRLYEEQNVDKAEELKLQLEQHQRERRKKLEDAEKQHEPFFFVKSDDEKGYYVLHQGKKNYWVRREARDWEGIPDWFQ